MNTNHDNKNGKKSRRLFKFKRKGEVLDNNIASNDPTRRRIDTSPPTKPEGKSSYLVDDTRSLDRKRREMEQEGHRQLAKVNARTHNENDIEQPAPEGELQNSIQQHPWLDAQRFDGIDPNLNPEPPLNTAARREFDNERREQEMEKQLRLGNMPKFSTAPKPSPS